MTVAQFLATMKRPRMLVARIPSTAASKTPSKKMPLARENGMHALRHYFASACLHNGVDIRALAAYLGHSDPGFTLRVYTHLMPDADDRMRLAVDAAFSASDGPATARGAAR